MYLRKMHIFSIETLSSNVYKPGCQFKSPWSWCIGVARKTRFCVSFNLRSSTTSFFRTSVSNIAFFWLGSLGNGKILEFERNHLTLERQETSGQKILTFGPVEELHYIKYSSKMKFQTKVAKITKHVFDDFTKKMEKNRNLDCLMHVHP